MKQDILAGSRTMGKAGGAAGKKGKLCSVVERGRE